MVTRHTMLAAALLLAAALIPTPAAAQGLPRAWLPGYREPVALDTIAHRATVDAPPGAVFAAASQVLEKLGVQATFRDSVRGGIGNFEFRGRRIAGGQLSRYLNCGSGFTGPYADTWRVTMVVFVAAQPADSGRTLLRSAFAAGAQDPAGASKDPVTCGSSGALEELILKQVQEQVAKH